MAETAPSSREVPKLPHGLKSPVHPEKGWNRRGKEPGSTDDQRQTSTNCSSTLTGFGWTTDGISPRSRSPALSTPPGPPMARKDSASSWTKQKIPSPRRANPCCRRGGTRRSAKSARLLGPTRRSGPAWRRRSRNGTFTSTTTTWLWLCNCGAWVRRSITFW
ncbi:hypothetical protein CGCSCA4_v012918 [Colletotrichum siamense]|uniref:Uncharacterized protein n=1 Tax=Colletotrichum siamense TaxID=690259 RepID=A0A9P5EJ17_COLSI|nr:hypothetical protein CGCSCA4_v012918 [Colletotrichum siamense]KAF4848751.1 hypothetical protein CGCSCA2_v012223 [Colletotrichum siamense]